MNDRLGTLQRWFKHLLEHACVFGPQKKEANNRRDKTLSRSWSPRPVILIEVIPHKGKREEPVEKKQKKKNSRDQKALHEIKGHAFASAFLWFIMVKEFVKPYKKKKKKDIS